MIEDVGEWEERESEENRECSGHGGKGKKIRSKDDDFVN